MSTTDPNSPAEDLDAKPLSIAEEIAAEVKLDGVDAIDRYESLKKGDTHITALQKLSMLELIELARQEEIGDITGAKKQDLVFRILKERVKLNGLMFGEGTLEILPDGFGFCAARITTTCRAQTISTCRPAKSAGLVCATA